MGGCLSRKTRLVGTGLGREAPEGTRKNRDSRAETTPSVGSTVSNSNPKMTELAISETRRRRRISDLNKSVRNFQSF